ncbi:MAG: amidohydrolase [Gammaproteobacteria bacterium]|nr:amidohydrolase [Gammaproteobacteria bacterium]
MLSPDIQQQLIAIRRDIHQHPELGWQESRTASKVCRVLEELDLPYRCNVGETGVVAEIAGQLKGPCIALRADLDALPIEEETGLSFSSRVPGVMHACAHDGHTSMLLGAAMLLVRGDPPLLPVRLIFQPAEETTLGARRLIDEGVLDDVAMIFGGHIDRHYPCGTLIVTEGAVNASSDKFSLKISGQGGHAARPHEAVDAVVVGSLLVIALQTIVSREINPAHPSVVSIGRFDAGSAGNVIAGHAHLEGSIRAQDPVVRTELHKSIRRIADSVAQLHDARIEVAIRRGPPPLINSDDMTGLARTAALQTVTRDKVIKLSTANMGGEDFSYYLDHVPGCYVRYGAQIPGREGYPAHSSQFDFDEDVLGIGATYLANISRVAARSILS